MAGKPERFIVVADSHGDMIDTKTEAALFEFMQYWKPKHRLHLGDAWDFRWLRGAASDDDKMDQNLERDFDAGVAFIKRFNPTVFLCGNHDWRVRKGMDSPNKAKARLCSMLWQDIADAIPCEMQPYDKRKGAYKFGDTTCIHGYAHGIGSVRKQTMLYGRCWVGHTHHIECTTVERFDCAEGRAIGSLCRVDMGYNEAQLTTLRQQNGWLYGFLWPNGLTQAWQAEKSPSGTFYLPSEMREVAA
jgi:hypothetical protein